VPLVGVIEPGARAAVQGTRSGKIGVIGTAGTIASGAYERAIKQLRPDAAVCVQACPLFVPLVEEGWFEPLGDGADRAGVPRAAAARRRGRARARLHTLPAHEAAARPCTGPAVTLVDSAEETAKVVAEDLTRRGLTAPPDNRPTHRFVVSDDEPHFRKVGGRGGGGGGARFLGEKLKHVEVVPLG